MTSSDATFSLESELRRLLSPLPSHELYELLTAESSSCIASVSGEVSTLNKYLSTASPSSDPSTNLLPESTASIEGAISPYFPQTEFAGMSAVLGRINRIIFPLGESQMTAAVAAGSIVGKREKRKMPPPMEVWFDSSSHLK